MSLFVSRHPRGTCTRSFTRSTSETCDHVWLAHPPMQHGVAGPCEDGPADRRQDYCFVNFRSDVSTASSLSTPNDPGTSRARMPARVLSPSVSTTPSSVILPFFTMMWIG